MIKGIVFDKDGTLTDFHKTWMPGIHQVAELFARGDDDLKHRLMVAGGWDPVTNRITSGSIIGAGDLNDLMDCYLEILPHLAVGRDDLLTKVDAIFSHSCCEGVVEATNLKELFSNLHARGVTIGVATMDSENSAHMVFKKLGVSDCISYVAGYDSGYGVKPSAGMIEGFLSHTGLKGSDILVVGDNSHDTEMGKNAGAFKVVGVLTGNSLEEDLTGHADYILKHVGEIPDLLDQLQQS